MLTSKIFNLVCDLVCGESLITADSRSIELSSITSIKSRGIAGRKIFFSRGINSHTFLYKVLAELFDQELCLFGRNFRPDHWHFEILLLLLLSIYKHMPLRNNLALRLCRNLFHEIDDSIKHVSLLSKVILLLLGANEDEFRVFLSGATLHLYKSFHCQQFIEADDLVTGGDIKTFFNDIGCDQNI